MMGAVIGYFAVLLERFGQGWNRFWFTPRDVFALCVLRILTGLLALTTHLSYTSDLVRWFGPHGWLPIDTVRTIAGGGVDEASFAQATYLALTDSPAISCNAISLRPRAELYSALSSWPFR